jgi:CHAD domain-containing protein
VAIDLRAVAKKLRRTALVRGIRREGPAVGHRAREIIRALIPVAIPGGTEIPFERTPVPVPPPATANGEAGAAGDIGLSAHLGQVVHKRLAQLVENVDFTGKEDPVEALHDLRVASRRLRAFIKLFEPMLDPPIVQHVAKPLRRITRAAGELRDLDVQLAHIEERIPAQTTDAARAALEYLLERISGRRADVQTRALKRIRKIRLNDVSVGMSAALGETVARLPASPEEVATLVWGLLAPLVEEVEANEPRPGSAPSPGALHQLRISFKKLRYALELVAPMLGEQRGLIKRAESLQELLGTHHDLFVIASLMDDERGRLEENRRHTLPFGLSTLRGELHAEERALVAEFEANRTEPGYFRDRIRAALARA